MSADALKFARTLALPVDAVTQGFAFLGRKGSGKTYGATKLAELMMDADAQIVALDPVGVWWGLRLNAAKTGPSPYKIPVLGGKHGDIPLVSTNDAAKQVADLVVDRGTSIVLDVSLFESDVDKARFAEAFAARFFFRKKERPSAVHLFIEEAQEFTPQHPQRGEERMLHAFNRIIKLGRNFGIGISLISQRPQEVNKKALNMTECLLAFQMTGLQERKTIQAWAIDRGVDEDAESLSARLPFLEVGTAHVWSPQWLRIAGDAHILKKRTADVSSTPKVGDAVAEAKPLGAIDLEQLRGAMAATIEKARADDPAELRKEIARLRRDLTLAQRNAQTVTVVNSKSFSNGIGALRSSGLIDYPVAGTIALTNDGRARAEPTIALDDLTTLHQAWYGRLPGPAARMLRAVIERHPDEWDRRALAEHVGYHPNAKAFANAIGRLSGLGLIRYPSPGKIAATDVLFPEALRV